MLIREVELEDLDGLYRLAEKLNTLNLQPDIEMLREQIIWSTKSFRHQVPIEDAEYLFVLEENGEILGSSLIIAQHGTYERPSVYFKVRDTQKYSVSLNKHFKHRVLDLMFEYDGPTEIGGLIIDKDHPLVKKGMGKALSFVRFLYIAMNRSRFRDEIVAELLPELRADGRSDLWEALGEKFCGIDYVDADRRSRTDIEFIRSLFPMFPIYTTLLPEKVQKQIGVVGPPSKPAESLLRRIGFEWDHSIDPFDGGPTYRCHTDKCLAVRRTLAVDFVGSIENINAHLLENGKESLSLVAKISPNSRFEATLGIYDRGFEGVKLAQNVIASLGLNKGDRIAFMPFSGINLISF